MISTFSRLAEYLLSGRARGAAGLDIGVSYNHSALVLLFRLAIDSLNPDRPWRPVFLALTHMWPAKTPLHQVVEDVMRLHPAIAYLTVEVNGVGSMVGQECLRHLRGARPRTTLNLCATTSRKKTTGYGQVLSLMEHGQLLLLRHADMMRQLAGIKFEQGDRGFTRIENSDEAVMDDIADALYLSTFPFTAKRGVGTRLSRWADPEHAVPDAHVPPSAGETFTTPGGLHVWRKPPLQSLEGQRLTFPSGWKEQPETVRQLSRFTIRKDA